jgi:hypothetical protein
MPVCVAIGERCDIVVEYRLERLLCLPFRMLVGERLHAIERERKLDIHRLFAPERAIVVEGCDALRHRDEIRRPVLGNSGNEIQNRLFVLTVVPRRQRIALP